MKNNRPDQLPLARTDQIIVKEVDDEVLVYDLKADQAHCLNKTAALVWKNCDGETSIQGIARRLGDTEQTKVDERLVWLALDQLKAFNLLQTPAIRPVELAGLTRRSVIRTMGITAIALPAIVSIISPSAVEAASCPQPTNRDPGCPCTSPAQCSSGNCHGAPGNLKC